MPEHLQAMQNAGYEEKDFGDAESEAESDGDSDEAKVPYRKSEQKQTNIII